MDVHLFRRVCQALEPLLLGAKVEKIHQADEGVLTFTVFGEKMRKGYLVLQSLRQAPFLYLTKEKAGVFTEPPAPVMRLRKYLSGGRILSCHCLWPLRRLILRIARPGLPMNDNGLDGGGDTSCPSIWLDLDLREGAHLCFSSPFTGLKPEDMEPLWPDAQQMKFLLRTYEANAGIQPESPSPEESWKQWPVLSPSLRRSLPWLETADAAALLMDLQQGGGDVFLYSSPANGAGDATELLAWPLPMELRKLREERIFADPLEAALAAAEASVLNPLADRKERQAARPHVSEAKRLEKLLLKLNSEEQRLLSMCAKKEQALLLQANLYRIKPGEKVAQLVVDGPEGELLLELNPRITVGENMEALFHQAGRGKRGLEHVALRRVEVEAARKAALHAGLESQALAHGPQLGRKTLVGSKKAGSRVSLPKGLRPEPPNAPKQVEIRRSSDGFVLLRGKDSKGNALALKMAAPHDYWLHTAQGASAHVIIRRDHPGSEVPESTLLEAGALVGEKSWLRDQGEGEIQYALAKHIQPMRNAPSGTVRIDASLGSFIARWQNLSR